MTMKEWSERFLDWGKSKGWNEEKRDKLEVAKEKLLLFHTEISEAVEELRNGNTIEAIRYHMDENGNQKPEGFTTEIADLLIRILHLCAILEINPDDIVAIKHNYNINRTYKHGGKLF